MKLSWNRVPIYTCLSCLFNIVANWKHVAICYLWYNVVQRSTFWIFLFEAHSRMKCFFNKPLRYSVSFNLVKMYSWSPFSFVFSWNNGTFKLQWFLFAIFLFVNIVNMVKKLKLKVRFCEEFELISKSSIASI